MVSQDHSLPRIAAWNLRLGANGMHSRTTLQYATSRWSIQQRHGRRLAAWAGRKALSEDPPCDGQYMPEVQLSAGAEGWPAECQAPRPLQVQAKLLSGVSLIYAATPEVQDLRTALGLSGATVLDERSCKVGHDTVLVLSQSRAGRSGLPANLQGCRTTTEYRLLVRSAPAMLWFHASAG